MTKDETFIFIQATRLDFHYLCEKIIHDGRDPYIVAEGMLEILSRIMKEFQFLWDEGETV